MQPEQAYHTVAYRQDIGNLLSWTRPSNITTSHTIPTAYAPISKWSPNSKAPVNNFHFGAAGTVHVADKNIDELDSRAHPAQVLHPYTYNTLYVQCLDDKSEGRCRFIDFNPIHPELDLFTASSHTFEIYKQHPAPNMVSSNSFLSNELTQAWKYFYAREWDISNDTELEQLDEQGAVE